MVRWLDRIVLVVGLFALGLLAWRFVVIALLLVFALVVLAATVIGFWAIALVGRVVFEDFFER